MSKKDKLKKGSKAKDKKPSKPSKASLSTKEQREALRRKQDSDVASRDSSNFGCSFLDTSKYPDVKWFNPKGKKTYKLDILPYQIKTKNHPQGMKPGLLDYVLDVWVHRRIGPAKKDFICLANSFGKPCPICEEKEIQRKGGADKEDLKKFNASRRVVYNVVDTDDSESEVQLFSTSHFLFAKEMLESITVAEAETGEKIYVADLEDGKTIKFRTAEEKSKEGSYVRFKDFSIVDREDSYDEDTMEQVYPLDALLVIPTYDEVKAAFFSEVDEEEEDDEEEEEGDEDDGDDSDDDDDEEDGDEDEDGEDDDDDDEEDDEDEEEEVKPAKKGKKAPKKEIEPDDDIEEEEEEKSPKKSDSLKKKKCPHGFKFGIDTDKKKECRKCKVWEECDDENSK